MYKYYFNIMLIYKKLIYIFNKVVRIKSYQTISHIYYYITSYKNLKHIRNN